GGAGFIASHVADRYLALGHEVAVLDNLSTGFLHNVPPQARFYQVDLRDSDAVARVFQEFRPEVVNHHAAQIDVRISVEDPAGDALTNVVGSCTLLVLCRKHDVRRFIYISSGGAIYGEPQYLPADEAHPVSPEAPYGVTKHTVEHYLEIERRLFGLPSVVLRYPNVYGPRQNPKGEAGVNAIFIGMMLEGRTPVIYGDGEAERDYLYVLDVVEANQLALTRGEGQAYNLGWGEGISVNRLYEILRELLAYPKPARHAPARPGEVSRIFLNAAKARAELGWEPRTEFRRGLELTLDFFRSGAAR
ncbi:MAG TPA: NAD-dependent epimerase/dehydratase family protein, partial [Candidatus Saccharimonadales bacterium]|nr:NAD-dependent epimerase/dehydratase family protein [Candidatus Saccharimonadales bacterium]